MHLGPSVTAPQLIAALVSHGICDEGQIVSLLGEHRTDATLNDLEMALIDGNVVSNDRLVTLKASLAGKRAVTEETPPIRTDVLDADTARICGALVLSVDPPVVAMVEDVPMNVDYVSRALGVHDFEIRVITSPQFARLYRGSYRGEDTDDRPDAPDIFTVLDEAISARSSDIHLATGQPPICRVDSNLQPLKYRPLSQDWMDREMTKLCGPEKYAQLSDTYDLDFAYTFGANRFRVNIGMDRFGPNVALRKIPTDIPTPDDLSLPPAIRKFCWLERGLVLVTGPTGSGKSTTLAALLNFIAQNMSRHIITLEDPIEYHIPSGKSLVNQRELGSSFTSFPAGLRQALRQDPDVVLVGELRDLDTMRTAITAAETGHLVFGTLHTYDTPSTLGRLVSSFEPEEQAQIRAQLAYILKGIVSQTLLPLKEKKGRIAAFEVMVSTPAVANNMRKTEGQGQLKQTLETGQKDGMQTMEMALAKLVREGLVAYEEAEHRAPDVEDFARRCQMT